MEPIRKPLQGVLNIIRFNWHFYILSLLLLLGLLGAAAVTGGIPAMLLYTAGALLALVTGVSLMVSCYVYDLSGLYQFDWIPVTGQETSIVNIHAGFDETSWLLKHRFAHAGLVVFDFYDPEKHTEVSIKRARRAYPPFPGTQQVLTTQLPLAGNSADKIFLIFAAHEIRDTAERTAFFTALRRLLKPDGEIIVVEHLRDSANFMAYNIGFFHFYSKAAWLRTFSQAQLHLKQEQKLTPFISTFTLTLHGDSF